MANPEHVEIVKQGAEAIAAWRDEHLGEWLDLSDADLEGAQLQGANLEGANLECAQLQAPLSAYLGGDVVCRPHPARREFSVRLSFISSELL